MFNPTRSDRDQVPFAALILGASGLIPLVAGAIVLHLGPAEWAAPIEVAVVGYGAVILSFLGGILWGRAITGESPEWTAKRGLFLIVSVVPSLIAWGALLIAPKLSSLVLVAAFLAVLVCEHWMGRTGYGPRWYLRLRTPLTVIVVASLIFTFIA